MGSLLFRTVAYDCLKVQTERVLFKKNFIALREGRNTIQKTFETFQFLSRRDKYWRQQCERHVRVTSVGSFDLTQLRLLS